MFAFLFKWLIVTCIPPLSCRAVLHTILLTPCCIASLVALSFFRGAELLAAFSRTFDNIWEICFGGNDIAHDGMFHELWLYIIRDLQAHICLCVLGIWIVSWFLLMAVMGIPRRSFSSKFINGHMVVIILTSAATLVFSRQIFDHTLENRFLDEFQDSTKFDGKTIVITGANSGVGFHAAKWFSEWGEAKTIYLGTRSAKKCEEAKKEILRPHRTSLKCFHFDLFGSIQELDTTIASTFNKVQVDLLVNNAGFFTVNKDDVEEHTKDVYSSPHLRMHTMHERLKQRLKAYYSNLQVVTVSSYAATICGYADGITNAFFNNEQKRWINGHPNPILNGIGRIMITFLEKIYLPSDTKIRVYVMRALQHNENKPGCSPKLETLSSGSPMLEYRRSKFWQMLGVDDEYETAVNLGWVATNIDPRLMDGSLMQRIIRNGRVGALPIVKAALKRLEILENVERRSNIRRISEKKWKDYLQSHSCITQQGTFEYCFNNVFFKGVFDPATEKGKLKESHKELLERAMTTSVVNSPKRGRKLGPQVTQKPSVVRPEEEL